MMTADGRPLTAEKRQLAAVVGQWSAVISLAVTTKEQSL